MELRRAITVRAAPEDVWSFLWQVDRMANCVPGCQQVEVLSEHERYRAKLEERIGPFKASFDVDVIVQGIEAGRSLEVAVTGHDRVLKSSLECVLHAQLKGLGDRSTELELVADYKVTGRVASLAQAPLARKAAEVFDRFAKALKGEMESQEGS